MFTTTCGYCGARINIDENRIPAAGLVTKCPACHKAMMVNRPGLEDLVDLPAPRPPGGDIIDLPAPKGHTPTRPATGPSEMTDLLAPVGPQPTRGGADLLAPVGPTSRKAADLPDLLAPVGPAPTKGTTDLLAPVGPTPSNLPRPVGPRPTELPDLLAPVGPTPSNLLTPVGPTPSNLVTPVGPVPSNQMVTPVGPTPSGQMVTPVGPIGTNQMMTPVGPVTSNLVTPVGPVPTNVLVTPVGPGPTKGVGLPAPKGFFDDVPPPQPAVGHGFGPPDMPSLGLDDLDDLDVVPAGQAAAPPMTLPSLDLPPPTIPPRFAPEGSGLPPPPLPPVPAGTPFTMDGLDLLPHDDPGSLPPDAQHGMGYGDVALPDGEDQPLDETAAQVVSFGKPAPRAPGQGQGHGMSAPMAPVGAPLSSVATLEIGEKIKRKAGTLAPELGTAKKGRAGKAAAAGEAVAEKKTISPAQRRRRRILLAVAVGLAALAGAGFYVYQFVELEALGFMTAPAKEREAKLAAGLSTLRRTMGQAAHGHWDRAAQVAERIAPLQRQGYEAQALGAQAYLAATLDEGLHEKAYKDKADALIGDLIKYSARGSEVDKAHALRTVLDPGKAAEAYTQLAQVERAHPEDRDVPLFMGWAALEAREWDKAQKAFARALTQAKDRPPALYGMGRAQLAAGDTDRAKETFHKLLDLNPDQKHFGAWLGIVEIETVPHDKSGRREKELAALCEIAPERELAHPRDRAHAWTLYGDEALAAGRFEAAAERFRAAKQLYDRDLEAMIGGALADVELRSQVAGKSNVNLTEARRALDQAVRIDPANVRAYLGLARIDLLEAKPNDARAAVDEALKIDAKDAQAHYWHGKVLEDPAVAEDAGAEQAYRTAIGLAPSDYASYVALSQLMIGRGKTAERQGKKDEAKRWSDQALTVLAPITEAARADPRLANTLGTAYLAAKDAAGAEQWFRAAVAADPGSVEARANLAATLVEEEKLSEAVTEYQQAHARAPRREDVALALAEAYERQKRFDVAEKTYGELLSTDGGNVPSARAHGAAGRYFARRENLARAMAEGKIISQQDPGNPVALFLKGYGELIEGKLNEAQRELTDACNQDPQAQCFEVLGRVYEGLKQLTNAEGSFDHARQMDSNYVPALFGLARLHLLRADYYHALEVLDRGLRLDADNAEGWMGKGTAHYKLRQLPEAVAAFQRAIKIDPARVEAYYRLGLVYHDQDKSADAIAALRTATGRAAAGTPWLVDAYQLLGFTYRSLSRRGEMCDAFRKYLEVAPPTDVMHGEVKATSAGCP
jgi:predicted Zn finger-like uncharacterized protein